MAGSRRWPRRDARTRPSCRAPVFCRKATAISRGPAPSGTRTSTGGSASNANTPARPPHQRPAADAEEADALAVDAHLDVVLLAGCLGELHGQHVLAVRRQVTADRGAAPGPEGQAVEVLVLNQIAVELVAVDDRRHARVADRQAADLARGGQVALQGRRRDEQQLGEVVEAAGDVVGRQQGRDVELLGKVLESQQVAHGILILGAAEAVQRGAPPRIGRGCRGPVELFLQPPDDLAVGGLGGPGTAYRRHRPRFKLADDALPRVGVLPHVARIERIERQAGGAQLRDQHRRGRPAAVDDALVVTGHAVAIERRLHGRGVRLGLREGRCGHGRRRRGKDETRRRHENGGSELARNRPGSPHRHGIPPRHLRLHSFSASGTRVPGGGRSQRRVGAGRPQREPCRTPVGTPPFVRFSPGVVNVDATR